MPTRRSILGVITALIALQIFLVPWAWPVLAGAIAVIWAWDYLLAQFPNRKRLVNWSMAAVLVLTAGSQFYSMVAPYNERSAGAAKRGLFAWDLWRAEKTNPSMLKSRGELFDHAQWLEDRAGEKHAARLQKIRSDLTAGRITMDRARVLTDSVRAEVEIYEAKKVPQSSEGSRQPAPSSPKKVIRVEVSLDKDTDWITIPTGTFTFEAPGQISFIFSNGEIRTVGDGEKNKWLGDIPSRHFRLRGAAGTVTLTSK